MSPQFRHRLARMQMIFASLLRADQELALFNRLNDGPALTGEQCEVLRDLGFVIADPLEVNISQLPQA